MPMVLNDIIGTTKLMNGAASESTTPKSHPSPPPSTLLGKFVKTHQELENYKYVARTHILHDVESDRVFLGVEHLSLSMVKHCRSQR